MTHVTDRYALRRFDGTTLTVCCILEDGVQSICSVLVRVSPARAVRWVCAVCMLSAAAECVRVVVCLA